MPYKLFIIGRNLHKTLHHTVAHFGSSVGWVRIFFLIFRNHPWAFRYWLDAGWWMEAQADSQAPLPSDRGSLIATTLLNLPGPQLSRLNDIHGRISVTRVWNATRSYPFARLHLAERNECICYLPLRDAHWLNRIWISVLAGLDPDEGCDWCGGKIRGRTCSQCPEFLCDICEQEAPFCRRCRPLRQD